MRPDRGAVWAEGMTVCKCAGEELKFKATRVNKISGIFAKFRHKMCREACEELQKLGTIYAVIPDVHLGINHIQVVACPEGMIIIVSNNHNLSAYIAPDFCIIR